MDGEREVRGARDLDVLRERLAPILLRRVRTEVLGQLPERTDTTIPVELTRRQSEVHSELDHPIASLAARAKDRPLSQPEFLRLMQLLSTQRIICNGMAQLEFDEVWPDLSRQAPTPRRLESLDSPKLLEFRRLVESIVIDQNRKVVVFSQWRRMLTLAAWSIQDILAAAGLRSAFFTGAEGPKRRTKNIVDFHDDARTAALFLTDAGGVGLNLQRAASSCILLDLPWNPAVLEQRVARVHRLGQADSVDIHMLVSRAPGIEARIQQIVASKRAVFESLFDGTTDAVDFDRGDPFIRELAEAVPPPADSPIAVAPEAALVAEEKALDLIERAVDDTPCLEGTSPAPSSGAPAWTPASEELVAMFAAMRITPRDDGGLTIDAPPAAASALATVFEGLAQALRPKPTPGRDPRPPPSRPPRRRSCDGGRISWPQLGLLARICVPETRSAWLEKSVGGKNAKDLLKNHRRTIERHGRNKRPISHLLSLVSADDADTYAGFIMDDFAGGRILNIRVEGTDIRDPGFRFLRSQPSNDAPRLRRWDETHDDIGERMTARATRETRGDSDGQVKL